MKIEDNENKNWCSECGGKCCKRMGCHFSPEQVFGDKPRTVETLQAFLDRGIFAVDWWDGDIRTEHEYKGAKPSEEEKLSQVYYVRMGHKGVDHLFDPSFGGECKMLTPTGCAFSFEDRPRGGQALVPGRTPEGKCNCRSTYTKVDCCIDWLPYQELFRHIY